MDGVEVIDRLTALSQLTQTIVLTGNASIESALHALRQRTYDYLVKPVPPEKLLTTIDRAGERWQRRRAEEALRQSEERAQLLLEHISDVVMVVDDALVIRYVSPSVRHLLDYLPNELLGRPCLDVVHPEDAGATETFLRGALRRVGPLQAHQLRVRPRNADWRVLEIGVTSLAGRTDMGGVLLTGRDVTERRRMEQALRQVQRMDSIGQLAGGVAHDFNNILTAILGFSEILLDDAAAGQRRAARPRGDPEGGAARRLAHPPAAGVQPAADARPEGPRSRPRWSRDFERMIGRVLGEHIRWSAHADADLWHVKADRGQLEQVLMNLAVNARDAMPDGGTLTIETRNATIDGRHAGALAGGAGRLRPLLGARHRRGHGRRHAGPHLRAVLHDQGARPRHRPRAGHRLRHRQAERRRHRRRERAGPGLDLPHLPAGGGRDRRRRGPPAAPRPAAAVESASILLIEDDAALRRLLARSLERVGHRVRDAADSADALAILAADPAIDLLVTDAVLPGQSGPNLARQIEADRPSLRVLFISGYSDDAILRLGLLNDQEAFLQKPFGPRTFVHKVQQVLRG